MSDRNENAAMVDPRSRTLKITTTEGMALALRITKSLKLVRTELLQVRTRERFFELSEEYRSMPPQALEAHADIEMERGFLYDRMKTLSNRLRHLATQEGWVHRGFMDDVEDLLGAARELHRRCLDTPTTRKEWSFQLEVD